MLRTVKTYSKPYIDGHHIVFDLDIPSIDLYVTALIPYNTKTSAKAALKDVVTKLNKLRPKAQQIQEKN